MTWKIQDRISGKKRVDLYILGDLHIGANTTDIEQLKFDIDRIRRNPYAEVALLGDLLELAMKPHMQREQIIPPHLQMDELKKIIAPIKNRVRWVFEGNHEKRVTKLVGLDYIKDGLKDYCKNARFLGMEGFIRYWVGEKYLLYLHHGSGGSTTTYHLLNKSIEKVGLGIGDAVVIAHGHKKAINEYWRPYEDDWTVEWRRVYGVRTGSYMAHPQYAKNQFLSFGGIGHIVIKMTRDSLEVF